MYEGMSDEPRRSIIPRNVPTRQTGLRQITLQTTHAIISNSQLCRHPELNPVNIYIGCHSIHTAGFEFKHFVAA